MVLLSFVVLVLVLSLYCLRLSLIHLTYLSVVLSLVS